MITFRFGKRNGELTVSIWEHQPLSSSAGRVER